MSENNEIWMPIPGYEHSYLISTFGRIKSLPKNVQLYHGATYYTKEKYVKPRRSGGYAYVALFNNGLRKDFRIHTLSAKLFIPNPENKSDVNHIDGDGLNNHLDNLEWATRSENMLHAYRIGLQKPAFLGKFGLKSSNPKKVQCLCTGRIMCVKDAAKELKINIGYMSILLKNRFPNWTNFTYV